MRFISTKRKKSHILLTFTLSLCMCIGVPNSLFGLSTAARNKQPTYYIDFENGDDHNSGASKSSPWKHSPGDPEATGNPASITLNGGDVICFKGGVSYRGKIIIRQSGAEDEPIVFKGDGWGSEKAIIDGADAIEANWISCKNQDSCYGNPNWRNIYYADVSDISSIFNPIYENDQFLWFAQDPNQPDPFWYDEIYNYYPAPPGTLTRTTLTDTDRFNQNDPDYYKGAYILVWCQPNVVTPREIQSFDPQSSTIQFEDLGSSAIYDNKEQYYSIINHISNLDRKGEYVYDREEGRLYIWPNSPEPQSAVFSIGKRDWAFRLFGSNVVIEGFEVRSFYGEPKQYYTGGAILLKDSSSENVVIRNNEIHEIRSMVGAGTINLVNAKNILIENNTINDCQQSSGIRASGENIVFRNNSISKVGRTAINFSNSHQSQIINNTICNILGVHGNAISTYQCNSDVLIAGNMVYDSTRDFTFEGDAKYPGFLNNIIVYNNIFLGGGSSSWGNITGITILNNIFASGLTINKKDKDIVIKNNIIGGLGIEGENIDISHNLYTALSWKQHSKYGWSLSEGEMIEEPDNVYVDRYNNDCHSVATNPGISAGTDVTGYLPLELFPDYDFFKDKDGNPRTTESDWDIGPFEFQETGDPTAIISYSSVSGELTGYEPFKIIFDGSNSVSPVGSIVTYDWDFGDGTVASGVSAQHVFSSGQYIVKLTVTDNKGKKNTASRKLIILASEFPNLYLYLPFDTDCLDASGKNMTVTSSDSLLFERTTYGRTIRFNNNESRSISVNHSNYLDGFDEATIAFLAKKDYAGTAATVIHKHTVYSIQIAENGLSGSFCTDSGSKTFSVTNVVDDTDWHHYAVTYDGSDIVLYIDGIECSRIECTGKIKSDSSRSIMIGRDPWGDSFEGLIDEIRIYDRALKKEEIKQVIEGGLVDNPPQDRILTGIITPSAITGVANGTAKTATALGLPEYLTLVTDNGNAQSSVVWDIDSCTYDPGSKKGQTFTLNGTVTLPAGVTNPNDVSLTVSISVTVKEATDTQDPGDQDDPKDPSDPGGSDTPDKPTKPSTPSTPTTPTPEPGDGNQDEVSDAALEDEDLITKDYPEMVEQLERLYASADIRDNKLNPTYGVMMKREPVISLTPSRQNRLKQLAKLTFNDILGNEWYASHIPMAVYRKLINGFPDGTFKGNSKVTRAEFLTMLARFNNSEGTIKQKAEQDAEGRAQMANLMGDSWYTNYIVIAEDGLVYSDLYTSETIVKPMTRGEVFYALANYLWKEDIQQSGKYHTMAVSNEDPAFSDTLKAVTIANPDAGGSAAKSYQWYKQLMSAAENPKAGVPMDFYPAIMCLKDKGILLGNNGESKWYDPISRAEALALFERLAKVWGEESN